MAEANEFSLAFLDELFNDDYFSDLTINQPLDNVDNTCTVINSNPGQSNRPIVFLKDIETVQIIQNIRSTNLIFAEIEIHDVKVLNDLIQQLSCCLQRKPFPNSSAKASWSSFHGTVTKCILKFNSVLPNSFLTLFSIKYFEQLITKNFFETSSENNSSEVLNLSSDEKNIVYYIGGSIIKKILKSTTQDVLINEIVNCLKDDSQNLNVPHSDLAHILDRGGLTYLTNKAAAFFIGLEICFRCMFPLTKIDTNISKINFRMKCLNNLLIKKDFYDAVTHEKAFLDKEMIKVMTLCIDKYFIVRAHQKCRRMIESYRSLSSAKKRKAQNTKGLRKKLKASVGQAIVNE